MNFCPAPRSNKKQKRLVANPTIHRTDLNFYKNGKRNIYHIDTHKLVYLVWWGCDLIKLASCIHTWLQSVQFKYFLFQLYYMSGTPNLSWRMIFSFQHNLLLIMSIFLNFYHLMIRFWRLYLVIGCITEQIIALYFEAMVLSKHTRFYCETLYSSYEDAKFKILKQQRMYLTQ